MLLEFQNAPKLLPAGVVLEAQVSCTLYFLLWCEVGDVTDVILVVDVRDGHRIYFVVSQEYRILQTFCYLTESFGVSGECVEVTAWIGE